MSCPCCQPYTKEELADIRAAIIDARKELLLSLMPSGVTGGGRDSWWAGRTSHADSWHYDAPRYQATSTPGNFAVIVDEAAGTVTVSFEVANEQHIIPATPPACEICYPEGGAS